MWITLFTHRFVGLAIAAAAVAISATRDVSAQQSATYEIVSSFDIAFLNGSAPSSFRQANDGSFYGTTLRGGRFDQGTLFRMDAAGIVTPLHDYSRANDGALPFGLVRASDGRFYGLTTSGGEFGFGTVFTITAAGPRLERSFASTRPPGRSPSAISSRMAHVQSAG